LVDAAETLGILQLAQRLQIALGRKFLRGNLDDERF